MREIKDTLGIKYNKYTDIYKADNEQLGLLLKYIMWEFGKDVILSDVSELTRKRIEKKSKEIEEQIEELLEDDEFERVFNSLTQQIKRSHKSWQQLKDNIENKKKDNTTQKAKSEPQKIKTEKVETTETATETENEDETDEENIKYEIYEAKEPGADDFNFTNEKQIDISNYAKDVINKNNEQTETIIYFLYRNSKKYNNSDECNIDEVINDYKKEFALPFSVDDD